MSPLDALGWFGSGLLVVSLLQTRIIRLRLLNTVACVILIVFNAALQIWPMVAMNIALALINIFFLLRLARARRTDEGYEVVSTHDDSPFVQAFIRRHHDEIRRYFPGVDLAPASRRAYLITRGDEVVGVSLVRRGDDDTARVLVDYVTNRFRNLTPGDYLYRHSGALRADGFTRVRTPSAMVRPYYADLGFVAVGEHYELDLTQGADDS